MDEIESYKVVYIFRSKNELLISQNGKVEKAKWEYLGSNNILIDRIDGSYLFRHSFFDENILALKIDGRDEYAILVNETKYEGELNSLSNIINFLKKNYIDDKDQSTSHTFKKQEYAQYQTEKGELIIEGYQDGYPVGKRAYLDGRPAADGKYNLAFLWSVKVKGGFVVDSSLI